MWLTVAQGFDFCLQLSQANDRVVRACEASQVVYECTSSYSYHKSGIHPALDFQCFPGGHAFVRRDTRKCQYAQLDDAQNGCSPVLPLGLLTNWSDGWVNCCVWCVYCSLYLLVCFFSSFTYPPGEERPSTQNDNCEPYVSEVKTFRVWLCSRGWGVQLTTKGPLIIDLEETRERDCLIKGSNRRSTEDNHNNTPDPLK